MDDEKNVLLRIVQDEREEELSVDFGLIAKHFKRLLALWLSLCVALGALCGACALCLRGVALGGDAKALISLASPAYDISKIASPNVIEDALTEMGMEREALESVRNALEISGVIPESDYERMSMYYAIVAKDAANAGAVQSLLDTSYSVSEYIITLHFSQADMSKTEGLNFLDALLRAYQNYCALNYNDNTVLENPLNVSDYRQYDYAEAANIFRTTLDNMSSYLSQLSAKRMGDSYRSVQTGFTFSDLLKRVASLKEIDLDRITSYIIIHSVSANPPEMQISYYEWLIENLTRQRAVQSARLASLSDSISAYEKDAILLLTTPEGAVTPGTENMNANYDAMIQEKLETRSVIAAYDREIHYYETVMEGFRQASGASDATDTELVRAYLESLNEKLTELTRNVLLTVNEYYTEASFANQIRVLVPAVPDSMSSSLLIKIVGVIEALLFVTYASAAVILGIRESNSPERKKPQTQEEPVPAAD